MFLIKQQFNRLYNLLLEEKPQLVDVIIWLQGDRYDRGYKVVKLYKDGYSKKIIISGNNVLIGNSIRVGENNISLDKMKDFLLKRGVDNKSIIVDDGAMNTKEQAEHIFKIIKNKKWLKLILVGSSYYQPRAFLTFLKQAEKIKWNGKIINQTAFVALNKKPSGRNKIAKIIFEEELEKIKKYKKDLISIDQGILYLNKKKFELRKVVKSDRKLLFDWANDFDARSNAKNSKNITWDEHIVWFSDQLSNSSAFMFILNNYQDNIGLIRFNKSLEGFVISYFIDKKFRGMGWGKIVLQEGIKELSKVFKDPKFIAYVKKGNIASEKIFSKLDFILKKEELINNVRFNIFEK